MVEEGSFRRDLYYRLNIIRLQLRPLRERKADIPVLSEYFVERIGRMYGKPNLGVSTEAMRRLVAYDYPGNVRELENAVQRAVILAAGPQIEAENLPPEIAERDVAAAVTSELGDFQGSKAAAVERFERGYLTEVLMKCGGIVSRASQYSGLSERNFQALRHLGEEFPNPGPGLRLLSRQRSEGDLDPVPAIDRNDAQGECDKLGFAELP